MSYAPLTPEQSKLAFLQLPADIDEPANVLFDKLLAADGFLVARQMRDGGHAFTDELQRQRRVTRAEADWMRQTFDNQWCKRIEALEVLGAPVIEARP